MSKQYYNTPAGIMELTGTKSGESYKSLEFFDEVIEFDDEECTLIEEPACPHAPQMLQYAYDAFEHEKPWELWECRYLPAVAIPSSIGIGFWQQVKCADNMFESGYEYRRIEKEPCREGALWSDEHTWEEAMNIDKEKVIFNLYEDIQCLKERIEELGEE